MNVGSSQEPSVATKSSESSGNDMKDSPAHCDASNISSTTCTMMTIDPQRVEPVDKPEAVCATLQTAMSEAPATAVVNSSRQETAPSATQVVGDRTTSTTETNVDDESVEALMRLVRQIQEAVTSDKLRKTKGIYTPPYSRHTGWPKNLAHFVLYASTSSNVDQFSNLFHCH